KILQQEIEGLHKRLAQLSKREVQLDVFREDLSHIEEMVKRFKLEQEALQIELRAPPRIVVLEEATVSNAAPGGPDWAPAGGAALASLCFGLRGLACLRAR